MRVPRALPRLAALVLLLTSAAGASAAMWRCPDGYTSDEARARAQQCERLDDIPAPPAADAAVRVRRSPDGHFYVDGSIEGVPVRFLVDTGATTIALPDESPAVTRLAAGRSVELRTAAGARKGVKTHATVRIGPLVANGVEITVGSSLSTALLGQSFLRRFDLQVSGDTLVIRRR